jgi:hypothetical protein
MNYFLLALATAAAIVAILYAANIVRVAFGKATFDSGLAILWHIVITPTTGVTALWLFQAAIAG